MQQPGDALQFAQVYANALDRLGDPHPMQRIGAVHTLELLAEQSPLHRQALVDVLCALLRDPSAEDAALRATVQRLLCQHLHPAAGRSYWSGTTIDLTGAVLTDLDLTGCVVDGALLLDHAELCGQTRMRGTTVRGPLSISGTTFADHAWLERSVFRGPVRGDGATFLGDAWFGAAAFGGPVSLRGVAFHGHAWFGNVTLHSWLDLSESLFRRSAGFRGASVAGAVSLAGTTFLGPARVSLREEQWSVLAPGWSVVVDPDNEAVGQLLWVGNGSLITSTPV